MHLSSTHGLLLAAWSADLVAAKTITISAGDVYFDPQNVTASVGDILEFHFLPHNHSVVMGDLDSPCEPAEEGGFYSGFLPATTGENAQVFRVTINDTDPIVYYCSQNASGHNHCKGGMFGFVNQPNDTVIAAYGAAAKNSSTNVSPDEGAFGGLFAANKNANATGNATSTGSSSAAGSTGSAGSKGSATSTAATSSNTGSPKDNAGAAMAGSGVLALLMALVMA